jgi:tetratricopeptide (TPR) repeat protein
MKQTQFDKHTIAWFRIAECVSRGEKERALGVYRLLSHSFNDNAVARQLEADIHLSFGEQELAIPLYQQAMELYQKSQRFLEAAAVCEHLIAIRPGDVLWRREAIKLYKMINNTLKMQLHTQNVLDAMLVTGHDHVLQEFMSMLSAVSDELHEYAIAYIKK